MRALVSLAVAAAAVVLAAACASAPRQQAGADCVLAAADTALLASGPVYRDCAVDRKARPLQNRVDFTPSVGGSTPRSMCLVAEVQFVVGTNGRPEPETIRLIGPASDFATSVAASVQNWVYQPATLNGEPVRQIVKHRQTVAMRAMPVSGATGGARAPACR